jgi:transcriptional regulator with XRE-family HTH domain
MCAPLFDMVYGGVRDGCHHRLVDRTAPECQGAALSVDQAQEALSELLAILDAEDWERFVELLDDDVELADELTAIWLRGREEVTAFLRAQAGIVTGIVSSPAAVRSRVVGPHTALVTFNLRQRYLLDGDERRERLTGCVLLRFEDGRPTVLLFHLGAADDAVADVVPLESQRPDAVRVERALGEEIRRRREQAGLSLRALAGRTGLSASFLSEVERSLADPSVSSLRQVAAGLGTSPTELLGPAAAAFSSGAGVTRGHERTRIDLRDAGAVLEGFERLPEGRLEAWIADMVPGGTLAERPRAHAGEEFVLVLAGSLDVSAAGRTVRLASGDGVHLDGALPHALRASGEGPTRFLTVQTVERP